MDPIATTPHTGLKAFDISPTYLGIEYPYGPYVVSVGADRDLRINYLFPPERDQDERVDEDDMENPELRNAAKVLAGHTGRDGHPGHKDTILQVKVLNLNGVTYIITGGDDGLVKVFDSNDDKLLKVRTFDGHNGVFVNSLDVIAEHPITGVTIIVSGSYDGIVQLWDMNGSLTANNNSVPIQTLRHPKKVFCLSAIQDKLAVGCGQDVYIWSTTKFEVMMKLKRHKRPVVSVVCIQLSYDTRAIAGSDDQTVSVWNLMTGEMMRQITTPTGVYGLAVYNNVDIPMIFTGGYGDDFGINVWELKSGAYLTSLYGHSNKVRQLVVWSHDGEDRLSSGALDGTILTFDLPALIAVLLKQKGK